MKYVVSALFWVTFALTAPVGLAVGLLLALLSAPFDRDRRLVHAFICLWTPMYLRWWPGWKVEVTGREKIPAGACVLVANHQSMADIVACMFLRAQFKFVSKASLFSLPLVGWMMRLAKYVSVVRGRPRSAWQMMEDCRAWLRRGMPVLLFPEGTYAEGGALLPFKRGAFELAIQAQVPLVPVLLTGTTGLVSGDGPWLSPRCRITVAVQDPIPPAELGSDADALGRRVRERYQALLEKPAGG